MKQKHLGLIGIVIIFSASLVAAFSSGPPDGRTGAPGESNCSVSCHSSFALNSGDGVLSITAPSTYSPSTNVSIVVDLAQIGQSRWGFEATILDTNNQTLGTLSDDNPTRTQITTAGSRSYIKHTSAGTDAGTNDTSPGWSFTWTPPVVSAGPMTIYVAGNAANNNGNNQGDYIYTTSFTINPAPVASCCVGIRGNVDNDGSDITDISDLVYLVDFMFTGGPAPLCTEEANIDGDAGENIDISDLVALVDFMFTGGPAPATCP